MLNGAEIPKIHDWVVLNKKCLEFGDEFESIQDHCIDLTDYSVQTRYPFHLEIEEQDAAKAVEDANKIKAFVLSKKNALVENDEC